MPAYLQHHHADLLHTLDDGVGSAGYGHRALRRVGQHVPCHLHLRSCGLQQRHSEHTVTARQAMAPLQTFTDAMEGDAPLNILSFLCWIRGRPHMGTPTPDMDLPAQASLPTLPP